MDNKIPVEIKCIRYPTMFCNPDACASYKICRAVKMMKIIIDIVAMNMIINCIRDDEI